MESPFSDFSNQISRIYCEIFLICDFWKRRHILAAKLVNFSVFEFTFVISEFQNSWSFNYLFSVSKRLVFRNKILHVDFWKRKSKLVQGEILITWFLESEIGLAANLADPQSCQSKNNSDWFAASSRQLSVTRYPRHSKKTHTQNNLMQLRGIFSRGRQRHPHGQSKRGIW